MAVLLPNNVAFIPSDATESNLEFVKPLLQNLPSVLWMRIALMYKRRGLSYVAQSLLDEAALNASKDDVYDLYNLSAYIAFSRGPKYTETGFSYLTRGESNGVTPLSLVARITYLKSLDAESSSSSSTTFIQAKELCHLCLSRFPGNSLVLITLGNLYRLYGDSKSALIYYIKALASIYKRGGKSSPAYNVLMESIRQLSDKFKPQQSEATYLDYIKRLYNGSVTNSPIRNLIFSEINFHSSRVGEGYDSQKLDLCRQYLLNLKESVSNLSTSLQAVLLSDISFQLGRIYHVQKNYQLAYENYSEITNFEPAGLFNLVKVAVLIGKLSAAKEASENLEQFFHKKSNYFTSYASLLSTISHFQNLVHTEKLNIFRRIHSGASSTSSFSCCYNLLQMDHNIALCDRLSNLHQSALKLESDSKLKFLRLKCLELLLDRGRFEFTSDYLSMLLSMDFLKNIPLRVIKSNVLSCKILLERPIPLDEIKTLHALNSEVSDPLDVIQVYISYNLALAMESIARLTNAQAVLKDLCTKHPDFVLPWLKRARIALAKKDLASYNRYVAQSKSHANYSPEPWLFHASTLYGLKRYSEAFKELYSLFKLHPILANESYTQTLASYCNLSRFFTESSPSLFDEAIRHATKALSRPYLSNFYAANALSIGLALSGYSKESVDSFTDLIADSFDNHHLVLANENLALVMSALSRQSGRTDKIKMGRAITLYKTLLKYSNEPPMSLCKYYFLNGNLEEAIEMLQYQALLFPQNLQVHYNLAVSLDAALCRDLRIESKVVDPENMQKMRCDAMAVEAISQYFIRLLESDEKEQSEYDLQWDHSFLTGMLVRARDKILPHIKDSLPTIEKSIENDLKVKEKRRLAQLEIQQAQIHMQQMESGKRERELEEERELSNRLLKEASEIAAELYPSTPPAEDNANPNAAPTPITTPNPEISPKKTKSVLFND